MNQPTLNQIRDNILQLARDKGFGATPNEINVAEKMALVHSEVTEAYTAYRHKNIDGKDGFNEELADIILRVLHLCGVFDIDIEKEISKKMKINEGRDWKWDQINESNAK
ncbi:hypothetical protein HON52_01385 [Candidatus Uhrbacteria bacterium]|jgi:NTP pyrophosphatase (non-canonical NTP hydrolase)|nr:hypothetical protein [Candidatus Uhrbacteria bacterium]